MNREYNRINYTNVYFRRNLNYLLDKYKLTKTELEKGLEMGDGSLTRYCKVEGSPEPKVGMLNSLANILGVTIDDLINRDLEEKEVGIIKSKERKEISFCKKLIKETINNTCDWEELNFYNHFFIQMSEVGGYIIESNWLEESNKFKSKFTHSEYNPDELTAFTVIINGNVQVIIMKFIGDEYDDNIRYELYLIKNDGKVIPSCASHKFDTSDYFAKELIEDEIVGCILSELYAEARDYCYYGKENLEREMIYDEYLIEIPF